MGSQYKIIGNVVYWSCGEGPIEDRIENIIAERDRYKKALEEIDDSPINYKNSQEICSQCEGMQAIAEGALKGGG